MEACPSLTCTCWYKLVLPAPGVHKAATFALQPALPCAVWLALAQLTHPSCLHSFSTVLLHVVHVRTKDFLLGFIIIQDEQFI